MRKSISFVLKIVVYAVLLSQASAWLSIYEKILNIMRNFETWDTQAVETELGLVQIKKSTLLEDWLSSVATFTEQEVVLIEDLRTELFDYVDFWNEDELKLQFIGPLLKLVRYNDNPPFRFFSQRTLSATINSIEIGGRVDFMLAKGKQRPTKPYFFIHEYKQEVKGTNDPKGQLLVEMITAQYRNENEHPVYGCYVIGRNWFFVVLYNNEYAVSKPYVASDTDIYKIVAFLREIKIYISKL
ncbi:MAG: hypothetical protein U5L45_16820 [Saprospiraceae bacterium]|nr:hypothetical protein [Saprospiraceae bacterium]